MWIIGLFSRSNNNNKNMAKFKKMIWTFDGVFLCQIQSFRVCIIAHFHRVVRVSSVKYGAVHPDLACVSTANSTLT